MKSSRVVERTGNGEDGCFPENLLEKVCTSAAGVGIDKSEVLCIAVSMEF